MKLIIIIIMKFEKEAAATNEMPMPPIQESSIVMKCNISKWTIEASRPVIERRWYFILTMRREATRKH